jgi:gliding motility-associated protein GldM
MSIPKEPRQQMINIMYLVLTALLALNVSAEILNAFRILKRGIDNSNASINEKISNTMGAFEAKVNKEKRGQNWLTSAKEVRNMSAEFQKYIDGLDQKLMEAVGTDPETGDLLKADDLDTPTRLFVDEGLGKELYDKIAQYRTKYASFLPTEEERKALLAGMSLKTDSIPPGSDKKSWEEYTFHSMPAQAVRTLLTKFKNDGISTEAAVVDELFAKVSEKTILYDRFKAAVIPSSTYLLVGEKYSAEIYLAASSSMARPSIVAGGRSLPLDADGMAKYEATASAPGEFSLTGTVSTTTSTGEKKSYPFTTKYTVATRAEHVPVVSADKMNVFYIGVDNPITCTISGIRSDAISTSISGGGGSAKPNGAGKFDVRVTSPGKATVNLSAKDKDGKAVNGAKEFRVKYIPDPIPTLGGKNGGVMGTGEFKAQLGMIAELKDFDFDAKFRVDGFEMTLSQKGQDLQVCSNSGAKFSGSCSALQQQAKVNSVYYFDNIKATGPDGRTRNLGTIAFKIK